MTVERSSGNVFEDLGFRDAEKRLAEAEAEAAFARERFDKLCADLILWCHRYGADLCPTGRDTYGEGMRAAKDAVKRIVLRHTR